ncbi:hypothetical protein C6P40_001928 [Pichia californica]|uniref:Genetic interactor of prohibitin 7, mitochondrial n=1 Tax=Pichia californica TaxID=460514 RepID=A0A9P6WIG0_9ASCO|nr:hypothetical protein C6P42_003674 [[Candida] californica]KAG0687759.1 hypothetical protein C6P40_001928 [[Candida] californica]
MSKSATNTINKTIKYAKPSAKLINSKLKQEQNIKIERNKLAMASVKDIFSIFNPNSGNDEDFDLTDFDCKIYYANPKLYENLPFFKQSFIIQEMEENLKKNWKSLDKDIKRFSIWYAYGSHGPRDGFVELHDYFTPYGIENEDNNKINEIKQNNEIIKDKDNTELDKIINKISIDTIHSSSDSEKSALQMSNNALNSLQLNNRPEIPPDLPFKLPSILKSFKPKNSDKIHKLPTLDPRSFGLKRLKQYRQDRRMNPINRIILVLTIFLTVLCFRQDRRVNVTGKVPDYPWDIAEREEREQQEKKQKDELLLKELELTKTEKENENVTKRGKKWYYLWLF